MCPQKCKHHTSRWAPKLTQSIQPFKYRQHPGNLPSFKAATIQSNNRLSKNHTAEQLSTPHSFGYYWCKDLLPACLTVWIRQVSMKLQILEEVFGAGGLGGNWMDLFIYINSTMLSTCLHSTKQNRIGTERCQGPIQPSRVWKQNLKTLCSQLKIVEAN